MDSAQDDLKRPENRAEEIQALQALVAELSAEQAKSLRLTLSQAANLQSSSVTRENCRAAVFVLYTGGTIGMVPRDPGNPASPLVPGDKDQIQRYVPGLGEKHKIFWHI